MLPATTHTTQPAQYNGGAWGHEGSSSKDLVIPKIQIAQAVSNICKDGNARPGDIYQSATKEVLVAKGGKIELLPIICQGFYIYLDAAEDNAFLRKEPITAETDSDVWVSEDFENNKPVIRQKQLSFLVLMTSKADSFPFFVEFSKSNRNGGKLLSTIMQENKFRGLPSPAKAVELTTQIRTYKQNSWYIFGVAPTRDATEQELATCKKWYDLFKESRVQSYEEVDNGIA